MMNPRFSGVCVVLLHLVLRAAATSNDTEAGKNRKNVRVEYRCEHQNDKGNMGASFDLFFFFFFFLIVFVIWKLKKKK